MPIDPPPAPIPPERASLRWASILADAARLDIGATRGHGWHPFSGVPAPPPGVRPANRPVGSAIAMDDASAALGGAWGQWAGGYGPWSNGVAFLGYPFLAELAQRPEYRNMVETLAEEMVRKWIKLTVSGDGKDELVRKIEVAMKRLKLREAIKAALELDGFLGMGVIYLDTGATDNPDELAAPLPLVPEKIGKGDLRGFVVVDPTWCSPSFYNSTDPLKPDFFVPTVWYVMGKQVHHSRLLVVRLREVPDILKASYNFGGVSLAQLAKPYVDNWLRTRQSVSDLLHSFTSFVLKTNLDTLAQNSDELMARIRGFILGRDNNGLMLVDKETEDFANVSVPLSGLDKLQAQAQEQMAAVAQEPLVKMLGVTPSGLNASSEGEIRVWYDRVHAKQEIIASVIETALRVIQLSEFGEIDDSIGFEFLPLWELDQAAQAGIEKTKAETDGILMSNGVIDNEEARDRLRHDAGSDYRGLTGPAPEPPEPLEIDSTEQALME